MKTGAEGGGERQENAIIKKKKERKKERASREIHDEREKESAQIASRYSERASARYHLTRE